ncbi:unnamed protein product [Bursaphelenchus xylophilus]|uniref:(pine wood nematode) hypothetical protein n=1 Tax=Bursaphelenchus xylophilus TaxID=6326 RepID=A0A1I7RVV4_BURXY|nr:unnamed protein product [Bursaphelenchus xylophilus]CAG9094747.1 unnamed protein product [Bursaphelenchus xylophilus]
MFKFTVLVFFLLGSCVAQNILNRITNFSVRPQQSVAVSGRFMCNGRPANNVKVKLYDNDHFTFDDLMANGFSDANGAFRLQGSANEFTNITPKLNVYHRCNYSPLIPTCYQKFSIRIPKEYITRGPVAQRVFDVGTLNLEARYAGQGRDCINKK